MIHTVTYDDARAIALALSAARRLVIGIPSAHELETARELLDREPVVELLEEFNPEAFDGELEKANESQARNQGFPVQGALPSSEHDDEAAALRRLGIDPDDDGAS